MKLMIDIETTDTAVTAQMIQIGAAAEDGDIFLANIKPDDAAITQQRFTESVATLEWWRADVRVQMFNEILAAGEEIEQVLNRFQQWVFSKQPTEVWCKGASFDFAILRHAFAVCKINLPWVYRQERCLRTYYALFDKEFINQTNDKFPNPTLHNGMEDAKQQLQVLQYLERCPQMQLAVQNWMANHG